MTEGLVRFLSQAITTVAEALSWLESTFLFVRIIKSPAHYSMSADSSVSPQARLKEFVLDAVSQLVDSGVVDRDGDGLASTGLCSDNVLASFADGGI